MAACSNIYSESPGNGDTHYEELPREAVTCQSLGGFSDGLRSSQEPIIGLVHQPPPPRRRLNPRIYQIIAAVACGAVVLLLIVLVCIVADNRWRHSSDTNHADLTEHLAAMTKQLELCLSNTTDHTTPQCMPHTNSQSPQVPPPSLSRPVSCAAVQAAAGQGAVSGEYTVYPGGQNPAVDVWCDLATDGGNWTVIQRRQDGYVDFFRTWEDYKHGFGYPDEEFWIGNDVLYRLTAAAPLTLRIDMLDWAAGHSVAQYEHFQVADETNQYRLTVSGFTGTAGDSLRLRHNSQPFSTKDRDNDPHLHDHCADKYGGGWWYGDCYYANLNGRYYLGGAYHGLVEDGVEWITPDSGGWYSLKTVEMKVRSAH